MGHIGERIRLARDRKVWTQDDLAQATGMPKASLSRIENGHTQPRQSSIQKIAAALGVEPRWLVFGDVDPLGPPQQEGMA